MLRSRKNRLRFGARNDRGQALVEFVLSILMVLILIFGIWELVMMVYTYTVIADAAKEGVRFAIVHGCDSTECYGPGACTNLIGGSAPTCDATAAGVVDRVKFFAARSLHDISAIDVQVLYGPTDTYLGGPNTSMPGSPVKVIVQYPYVPMIGLGWRPLIHASATGSIAN